MKDLAAMSCECLVCSHHGGNVSLQPDSQVLQALKHTLSRKVFVDIKTGVVSTTCMDIQCSF